MVDEGGRILEGRRYRHDARGITALCRRLVDFGVELVAVERPDGLLIERLLDAGLSVVAIHPNQVAAMRPRFSAAGGRSDSFDSFVLAELARTDSHRYRVLVPDSDATKALRAQTRAREDLVQTRVALANELRAQLGCFWPGAGEVFADIDSPIALAFQSAVCAATMLAQTGDRRPRYPTKQALSADGGQSPVAVESGKSKRARFRWACDHRDSHAARTVAAVTSSASRVGATSCTRKIRAPRS